MTTLTITDTAPAEAGGEALVLFTSRSEGRTIVLGADRLPKATVRHVEAVLDTLRAEGGPDEVRTLTGVPKVGAPLVVVSGAGRTDEAAAPSPEALRRAAGAATRSLAGRGEVVVLAPSGDAATVAAVAEGALLGVYAFHQHRSAAALATADGARDPVAAVTVLAAKGKGRKSILARAEILARHQGWARDLVNTAPNELYPQSFAAAVRERAPRSVEVSVLDEKDLRKGGFGGIVGVGQGSARPPRLVTMTYRPDQAQASLAFVGKGITFDSGGLCIKPAGGMITMKCDMGGAAAVAGAVLAVAELGLPVAVTGYLCLAENMPGADAQRPGDVVTMRNGQTVEIINTDAEGRLVMADGIALAAESRPDAIVDVATLTGAAIVALGKRTAAVMANDEELQGELAGAATAAGETVWPMPIAEETRAGMDSLVADLKHTGEPHGGAMVAAAFLREFAGSNADGDDIPWGHLDIAGPAYNEGGAFGYTPKGGTGFGLRALVAFAESRS